MSVRLPALFLALALALGIAPLAAQTVPAPTVTSPTANTPRPIPGPVFESPGFTRAVGAGTRTRSGAPGPRNWVQHARYTIDAALDPIAGRVTGRETVTYRNHSPDTLRTVFVYLRQNLFAPGNERIGAAPITGGVTLTRVAIGGQPLTPPDTTAGRRRGRGAAGSYLVQGTVMRVPLATPLLPGDSLVMAFDWSYAPPPSPSDGRQGREGNVFFMGYWYPQLAVYDDIDGWVTDPYLSQAEFYMDPADYDVRLTVPYGWTVGATGLLINPADVLTSSARDSLAAVRRSGRVIRLFAPGQDPATVFARRGATTTWQYRARDVRDFAWGASNEQAWDATRALVTRQGAAPDTVDIHSFFRLTARAAAWNLGGARFTRDAIEKLSDWLWPYPWPTMSSMEGVLTGGGMEYPMMTVMQPWPDTLSLAGDLMHETGHMWFPMQVGSNETRFPWMDEGFTQFNVAQTMAVLYGAPRTGGRPNDAEAGQRQEYLRFARAGQDYSLMLPGDGYPGDRYMLFYNKTAQVLAALRSVMGADTFHDALVRYGRDWTGRHPQPYDFFNAMNRAGGKDLSWFWQTWFYHGWPLDQAIADVATRGDSTVITVEDHGMAPMPVRLRVTHADGSVQNIELPVTVWLGGSRRATASVAAKSAVTRVEIDAAGDFPDIDRSNQVWPRKSQS
ncbi:MAG: M1 family metallopeptidase [Gemmatimonadota bacterium]